MATPRRATVRGRAIAARRKVRELAMVARALASTAHPVLAQIIPMRFCNLSCAYCNEYDKVSEPVAVEEMYRRIDHLGRLGTAMIGISGGEPLTHPGLDDIIRRMRRTMAIAEAMRKIKGGSSQWLHESCGLTGFEWQKGYGAFSVGCSQVDATVAYIAGQKEHHRKRDFQTEFLSILKRHGIEYDPRYVWG